MEILPPSPSPRSTAASPSRCPEPPLRPRPNPTHTTEGTTAMKLGAYTACLHDKSLDETLTILRDLGLTARGQLRRLHRHAAPARRRAPRQRVGAREVPRALPRVRSSSPALNCNGNPRTRTPRWRRRTRRPQARDQARRTSRGKIG